MGNSMLLLDICLQGFLCVRLTDIICLLRLSAGLGHDQNQFRLQMPMQQLDFLGLSPHPVWVITFLRIYIDQMRKESVE
jgi:hypothetical protein